MSKYRRIHALPSNTGFTLDLFRANEKLNARKRHRIEKEMLKLPFDAHYRVDRDTHLTLHSAIQTLFEQNKLVLCGRNLPLHELMPRENETHGEFVTRSLKQLLTIGKVDLEMDTAVSFSEDQRVPYDIKLLAKNGDGEDHLGNNLPLPPKLSYLRK